MSRASWLIGAMGARAEKDARSESVLTSVPDLFEVPLAELDLDENQPRKDYSKADILELAASIERHGLLHPVVVRQERDRWKLIAGHRRVLAHKQLGLLKIKATVDRRQLNELRVLELQIAENVQRQDLSPIETARAYRRMQQEWNVSAKDLAQLLGLSESKVCRTLRLLDLDAETQRQVAAGELTPTKAVNEGPRKRPRKSKPKAKPTTWSCKPQKGLTVTVTSAGELDSALILEALSRAAEALRGRSEAA
jgi:ParB family chromosome partitioning protein